MSASIPSQIGKMIVPDLKSKNNGKKIVIISVLSYNSLLFKFASITVGLLCNLNLPAYHP